jgi:ATP-dependent RNA circularization protein (DNA/RNA ligase family)
VTKCAGDDFFKFPHTPHLAWLGSGQPRGDKVMEDNDRREFLAHPFIVEEKVDGANLGLSVGDDGDLRIQNRGSWIHGHGNSSQFKTLFQWVDLRRDDLIHQLRRQFILFGEWCYAVHTVRYSQLPDWFLAFDLYDRSKGLFVAADERDEFVRSVNLHVVPCLGTGRHDLQSLKSLLGTSVLGAARGEGLYLRTASSVTPVRRAKLVTPEFTQMLGEHWSRRLLQTNSLGQRHYEAS